MNKEDGSGNVRLEREVRRYSRKRLGSGPEWAVLHNGKFSGVIGLNEDSGLYDVLDWSDGYFSCSKTIKGCMEWLKNRA